MLVLEGARGLNSQKMRTIAGFFLPGRPDGLCMLQGYCLPLRPHVQKSHSLSCLAEVEPLCPIYRAQPHMDHDSCDRVPPKGKERMNTK